MNILLINDNPVVSKRFAFSTCDKHIELDKVKRADKKIDVYYV